MWVNIFFPQFSNWWGKKTVGLGAAFIPLNNALERATSRLHWLLAQARMLTYADAC